MARQTILKERDTGEVMYPHTLASLVQTADGGNVDEGLAKAKRAVFVDQWNSAWGKYGKYDPVNAPDAEHPFMGNDIWMTYAEAVTALQYHTKRKFLTFAFAYARIGLRTFIPPDMDYTTDSMRRLCANSPNLEKVVFRNQIATDNIIEAFTNCPKLRVIEGPMIVPYAKMDSAFSRCYALEEVRLQRIGNSVRFADSPKLSYASLDYLVSNADNGTKAITITVHPDVYAKLTGDTANAAAAALTQEELAQWQQVLTDAAEKNINFATT